MLRVQLINQVIGSKILELADPIDINSLSQTFKRSEEADGVFYEIVFDLEFIKDGRDFIWQAYEQDAGIDSVVTVNLYERDFNQKRWRLVGTGQIDYKRFDLGEVDVVVNIEQTGIERRIMNMKEIDVDLETTISENGSALPVQSVYNVPFHSKKLLLQFKGEGTQEEFEFQSKGSSGGDSFTYIQFPLVATFDEIAVRQDYPLGPSEFYPPSIKKYNWRVEVGGVYRIDIPQICAQAQNISGGASPDFNWWFEIVLAYGTTGNYQEKIIYTETKPETQPFNINVSYNTNLDLQPGDEVYLFLRQGSGFAFFINFRNYTFNGPLILKTEVNIDAETLFPETQVRTVLLYEAIQRCLQYYTNTINCFKSTLLGRVDLGYEVDGEFALIGITNGHRLRKKNDHLPIGQRGANLFSNLEDLIQFVKVIACADFGFEYDEEGNKIFVLEKKEYFYKKDVRSVSLGRVYDVRRRVNPKRFYNRIEVGYSAAIDVRQYNAVDEFNTKRKFSLPIINVDKALILLTDIATSGYLIESQRRLQLTTEDGKYDDKNFAAVLLRDGDQYRTKKDEGYAEITNVLFPNTGYNYDLSPARILRNWSKVIASSLIRSRSKIVKFSSGEVNYIMTTRKNDEAVAVAENGDLDLSDVEAIWDNEDYVFNHPVTREQISLLKSGPYAYFDFTDKNGNVMEGFIPPEGIEYDNNKNTAEFIAMRVHRTK